MFDSVRTGKIPDSIVHQLQEAILGGHFAPGDRLPSEREMVERFEASRSSVREAMRTLQSRGFISIRSGTGGGAYVNTPDFELVSSTLWLMLKTKRIEVAELYQARLLLEPGIAAIAAELASDEDVALLRASVREHVERAELGEATAGSSHGFHFLLARASHSYLLQMLMSTLMDLANRSHEQRRPVRSSTGIERAHREILQAIERGQGEAARRLTKEHLVELISDVRSDHGS